MVSPKQVAKAIRLKAMALGRRRLRRLGVWAALGLGFARAPSFSQSRVLQHLLPKSPVLRGAKVGGEDAPSVFLLAPPSEHLTKYLLEDPSEPFGAEWPERLFGEVEGRNEPDEADQAPGKWQKWDFHFSKREPFLLKADWHSVPRWGDRYEIFVPRKNAVAEVVKAPNRTMALLEAFRAVNEAVWQRMARGLRELLAEKPDDILRCRLLTLLIEHFEERGFFGAIEAQAGPPGHKEMHWHKDGATGLLHLGITLSGRRRLQLRAWGETSDEESWTQELWMAPGHIYLSSPFLFEHGITYSGEGSGKGPTLALMCRFGFLDEEKALWVNHLRSRDMLEVAQLFCQTLREAADAKELKMPSLAEVKRTEKRLAKER